MGCSIQKPSGQFVWDPHGLLHREILWKIPLGPTSWSIEKSSGKFLWDPHRLVYGEIPWNIPLGSHRLVYREFLWKRLPGSS